VDTAQTLSAPANSRAYVDAQPHGDLRLCSALSISRCHVHAIDGIVGVQRFLIEENTWAVRYLAVNTSAWPSGHPTLIAAE
jgi:hypothetical protein